MIAYLKFASIALLGLLDLTVARPSDCRPNTWLNLKPIPVPRQEHSTVALNETTIAVIGGVHIEGASASSTDLVQFYDIPSDTWRNGTSIPYGINHPNAAAVNGRIYLLGGLTDGALSPGEYINWVATTGSFLYDPATETWSELAPMPNGTERGSAIVGVHNDIIYLAGGMTVLQNYQDSLTTVNAFNTTSGSWIRLPPAAANIPEGRQHGTGGVIGNKFYVVGGRWFGQMNVRGTVYELDLTNQEAGWKTSPFHMPVPRGGLAGGIVGERIYTFGGEGDPNTITGVFNQSESYDVKSRRWSELKDMAVPRHGTSAVAIGNKVYIPGGGLQQDGKVVDYNGTLKISNQSNRLDAYCV
jgi:N-acetylneuraminic acid mutarotase